MKKIVFAVLGLLLILGVLFFLNLSGVAQRAIEIAGTHAFKTPVHVGSLKISLGDKKAVMKGLFVANPKGFNQSSLLKTDLISVTLDDVTDKTVLIKEVVIDGMTVTYEMGPHGTNVDTVKNNLKSSSSADSSAPKKPGPDVAIQQLKIIHARLVPDIGGVQSPVNLPDIVLNNIGTRNSPVTPARVAAQVMNQVLSATSTAMLKSGLLSGPAGEAVNKAQETLKGFLPR